MSGILCSTVSYIFSSNLLFYSQYTICNTYKEVDFYAGGIKGPDFPDVSGNEFSNIGTREGGMWKKALLV